MYLKKLLAITGISPNGCISVFEVLHNNRMQPHAFDCNYFQHVRNAPVRVLAKMGKKWLLDPYPSIAHMCDMMWLYAKELVTRSRLRKFLSTTQENVSKINVIAKRKERRKDREARRRRDEHSRAACSHIFRRPHCQRSRIISLRLCLDCWPHTYWLSSLCCCACHCS